VAENSSLNLKMIFADLQLFPMSRLFTIGRYAKELKDKETKIRTNSTGKILSCKQSYWASSGRISKT
jgi:hypothetical protein